MKGYLVDWSKSKKPPAAQPEPAFRYELKKLRPWGYNVPEDEIGFDSTRNANSVNLDATLTSILIKENKKG